MKFLTFLLIIAGITISACEDDLIPPVEMPDDPLHYDFTVNDHFILERGVPLEIKGMVYVPGYPGFLPWDIERSTSLPPEMRFSILTDIRHIQSLGVNTVRFWGAPRYCYEALKTVGDLYFIQTIWIRTDAPDFQDAGFKENTKAYIREVIDRIYSVFIERQPPLIAYLVGNELSRESILSTDAAHPDLVSFRGNYIMTDSARTATEVFLAEMADYVKTYEYQTYGQQSLVSYANEIRTADLIETPFLDFISHNAYSYAVPYYRPGTAAGSSSGTLFQGWIEEIKARHPTRPLLITETGLSVSPNAQHVGPPNYGYGGNTEVEQATGLMQNVQDIESTVLPTAGVCIHEYLDAWWKFGLEDSYSQDPDDIEEWFGIAKLVPAKDWYATEYREAYHALLGVW
ncbi:MAG: hypothetical protein R3301_16370 [Saprospiraceae bacterium]|nr:hypothetical protein [Saprospiraceae bacterium]